MQSSGAWKFDLGEIAGTMWDAMWRSLSDVGLPSTNFMVGVIIVTTIVLTVVKTFRDALADEADL